MEDDREQAAGLDADRLVEHVRALTSGAAAPTIAPVDGAPATPEERDPSLVPLGFVRSLGWRLAWRDTPETSDAVIACCAVLALAIWLAFDRHAAGPNGEWYAGGMAGLSWYVLGLIGLAWVLHRASSPAARYRSVVAAIASALPVALVLALSIGAWVPSNSQVPLYALLTALLILFAHRVLVAATGRPQVLALAVAALALLAFEWATRSAWVDPHLWYASEQDAEEETEDDDAETERLVFEQADRIDAAAAQVAPGRPGRPDVFFLGFAGFGDQKVFAEELKLSEGVVAQRYGAAGRSLLLINDRRDREAAPFATIYGLKRALLRMGERMDDEDVLFLMMTSHGSDTPALSVSNGSWPLAALEGDFLREALDASGIRWRVIVISACHSGGFIDPVADDHTIVVTSAAADRTSFGCSDDNDLTDFGAAFIRDALPGADSLAAAFETARKVIEEQEGQRGLTASSPQARFGRAIEPLWAGIEAQHHSPPARSATPDRPAARPAGR